jgi:uncharacterized protein (DUF433 family)
VRSRDDDYGLRCAVASRAGMTPDELVGGFPYLTKADIQVCLAFVAGT